MSPLWARLDASSSTLSADKSAGCHQLFGCLRRLFAKCVYQVKLGLVLADRGSDNRNGRVADRKLHHALFADHFGGLSDIFPSMRYFIHDMRLLVNSYFFPML